ncbi:ninein [Patella vulgata]|uniref:ninein n=1 Tax=Patella vulgata TaxID=6465 RepID=UPI0021800330|nr:ninein [Patella vulgata]
MYRKPRKKGDDDKLERSRTYSVFPTGDNDGADETFESEGPLDVSTSELGMDRLQEIWTELGVGKDGYLTLDELSRVCNHIGMKGMTDEEIHAIFVNLDGDQDGKVSFNEFIRGFLHHLSDHKEQHLSPISRVPQSMTKVRRAATFNKDDQSMGPSFIADGGAAGLFSAIDPDNTGSAKPSDIIDLWERVGITQGLDILMTLGFEVDSRVNLAELSFDLERELLANNNQDILYQAALATYQQEIKHLRVELDNVSGERDKLRLDLTEANTRNTLMAKESDERHANLEKSAEIKLFEVIAEIKRTYVTIEKKYTDQIKSLQSSLDEERESHSSVSTHLHKQLKEHREAVRLEETALREQIEQAQIEIQRLEEDRAESVRRLLEAEKMIHRLQKELEVTGELRQKLSEYERLENKQNLQDQKFTKDKLIKVENENKNLKDKNDELTAEVETMRHKMAVSKRSQRHSTGGKSTRIPIREGSLLSDYGKTSYRKNKSVSSLPSLSSVENEIEEDEFDSINKPIATFTDLPSPDEFAGGSQKKVANLQKELRENREYLEREKKEIEHAYRLEIAQLEEQHLHEKEQLLRNVEEAKAKEHEAFNRSKDALSAEMQKELQTSFAMEKQDLVLKYESEKNHLEHNASEERRKLTERLKEEFDRDVTHKMIELKNEFNTERTKLEDTNRDQQITIQSLKRKITEVDLKMKLQEEELSLQFDQERQDLKERHRLELKQVEMSHKREIMEYENMLCGGVECLKGKLKDDFYGLLSQQKEEELIVDRSAMLEHMQQNDNRQMSLLDDERSQLYAEFEAKKCEIIEKFEKQIEALKQDMDHLKTRMDEERQQLLDTHTLEKETLEESLSKSVREEIEGEFTQHMEKLKKTYEEEQDALETRNRISEEEILFLQQEVAKKEEQLAKMEELDSSVAILQEDKKKLVTERQELNIVVNNYESELSSTKSSLQQKLEQVTSAKIDLETKVEELLSNKCKLEKKVEELKTTKYDLERRIDEMNVENDTTLSVVKSEHLEALSQSELKEQALIESFKEEKSVLDMQIVCLKEKVEQLQEQINDIVHLESMNEHLSDDKKQLEDQITDSMEQNTRLKMEINRFRQNEEDFEDKITLLEKEIERLSDEDVQLKGVCEELSNDKKQLEHELQESREHSTQLQGVNEQLTVDKKQLDDKIKLFQHQIQELTQQNTRLQSEINRLKQNEGDFEDKVTLLEKELERKSDENIQLETVFEDVSAENSALVAQVTVLKEEATLQQKKAEMILEADNQNQDTVVPKEVVEKRLQSALGQVAMATQNYSEDNESSEDKENIREEKTQSHDAVLIKMLQEDLKQMTQRKEEYKRLAENLKKQMHDLDKMKHKHDKEQIVTLQKEKEKLENILQSTNNQNSWLRSMTEDLRLFEASTNLAKSQYKYVNEIQSWKEKTNSMVDLENYTKVQLNLFEQQRLVLLLQDALRTQHEATEKLHKDLVQGHNKKMAIVEGDKQRLTQKLEQYKSSLIEVNDKYCTMLSENKNLFTDKSKLTQTLRDTVKREMQLEKKCEQLQQLAKTLRSLLNRTYCEVLS